MPLCIYKLQNVLYNPVVIIIIIIIMIFINVTCYSEKKDQSEIAQPMVGLQVTGYTSPGPCREGVCITKPLWNKN